MAKGHRPRRLALSIGALLYMGTLIFAAASPGIGRQDEALTPRELRENLASKKYSGRRIDLVFSKAGLQEVIAELEKAGGIPLKLAPSINDPVTYRMLDVPWDEALAAVLSDNALRLDLNLDGSGFKIGRGEMVVLAFPKLGRAKIVMFLYEHLFPIAAGIAVLVSLPVVLLAVRNRRGPRNRNGKKALLPPETVARVKSKLIHALKDEHVYRDQGLTLRSLSEDLDVSLHQLSWIVNEELGLSFSSLINGYRIDEVKDRLTDASINGSSILQLALEAGFNSKASFNRAFKIHTGMTPSEFKKGLSG